MRRMRFSSVAALHLRPGCRMLGDSCVDLGQGFPNFDPPEFVVKVRGPRWSLVCSRFAIWSEFHWRNDAKIAWCCRERLLDYAGLICARLFAMSWMALCLVLCAPGTSTQGVDFGCLRRVKCHCDTQTSSLFGRLCEGLFVRTKGLTLKSIGRGRGDQNITNSPSASARTAGHVTLVEVSMHEIGTVTTGPDKSRSYVVMMNHDVASSNIFNGFVWRCWLRI